MLLRLRGLRQAACGGVFREQFVGQWLTRDFVSPIGASFEPSKRSFDIGQIGFDGIEVDLGVSDGWVVHVQQVSAKGRSRCRPKKWRTVTMWHKFD